MTDELLPLSVLALDVDPPATGWDPYLADHGITVRTDRLGRRAVTYHAARELIAEQREQREAEARKRQEAEQRAVEADQQFRAQLWTGVPADQIPDGVSAAEVWAQVEKDSRPRRTSVLEHALSHEDGPVFHPIHGEP